MRITQTALQNPVAVIVAALLVALFGLLSLFRLPIQLTPNVERPVISVDTRWSTAAPEEIESEIIEPQEDVLRNVPGLTRLESSASQGEGDIDLEFSSEMPLQRALLETINRLNQVSSYPPDANEPRLSSGGGDRGSAIAWFALRPVAGNDRDIVTYQEFVDDVVKTRIERINGIASSGAFGGRGLQVRIDFDAQQAAALGIDLSTVPQRIGANADVSGGLAEVGRRSYSIRYAGRYQIEDLGEVVLDWRDGRPVYLKDIAEVSLAMTDLAGSLTMNGGPAIAVNAVPEVGVNILDVMAELKALVAEMNDGVLANNGLYMSQVYDESLYIEDSVAMVRNNLLLGIVLAIGVLWVFLRKLRATLLVAMAIPLCLLIAFVALAATGRTLNIISLAGLAFATGIVMDAAIVVLENIVRLKEEGLSGDEAADQGASQVLGALIASTATTVAIFLPIVFLDDVAGQLFRDLALTISFAVVGSLLVAITVLPTAARFWLRNTEMRDRNAHWWRRGSDWVMMATQGRRKRWLIIAIMLLVPLALIVLLRPNADYLPEGNRNLVFAFVQAPPGIAPEVAQQEIVDVVKARLQPHIDGTAEPQLKSYFFGLFGSGGFLGVRAEQRDEVDAVLNLMNREVLAGLPDTRAFASRRSIFGRFSGGRSIDVDIQATDTDALLDAAAAGFAAIGQAMPGAQVRPIPGLELASPELRFIPNDRRIAEVGWDRTRMATVSRALGDGAFVGEYFAGDKRYNMVLRGTSWSTPEELAALPVATPSGEVVPVGDLLELRQTAGPDSIRRVDRTRTITLRVTPPSDLSMEEALAIVSEQADQAIRPMLPADGRVIYSGSAADLENALRSMGSSFALAVIILYLLMSALFRSFTDSLLVLMTIPLATVGGVIALALLNTFTFQPMDLLTMIGFVILLGIMVNNAILLVHQARSAERRGETRRDAVAEAVRLRIRPILMSTTTTVFGMLPLVIVPGAGTELYRGLASVIVGGMCVSTLFTLVLLPAVLRMGNSRRANAPALQPARAT